MNAYIKGGQGDSKYTQTHTHVICIQSKIFNLFTYYLFYISKTYFLRVYINYRENFTKHNI